MRNEKSIKRTSKQFGTQVENYNKYRSVLPKEFYNSIFDLNKREKVEKVLDLGCGTGKSTENLVKKDIEIFGCDHDSKMLYQAKKNSLERGFGIKYKKCEAENLPFQDNYFDIVTIGNAFHWFANKKAVKNIERVLKPRGLLFIYWKQIDKEDIKLRRKIFRQFNPNYSGSGKLITFKKCKELLDNNGFQKTKHLIKKFPFYYNLESAIGRLKTTGSYFNLTHKQKLEFDKVAKNIFEDYFAQKKEINFLPAIHIGYTYKK